MEPIIICLWVGIILPWIVFCFAVDWSQIKTIHSVGLLIALMVVIMDVIGSSEMFWVYPARLSPIYYIFFPADLAIIPVEAMLIAQYMPKRFIKKLGLVFAVSIANVVAESWMEGDTSAIFYFNWKPIYSLPFYVLLFFIGYYYHRWLTCSKS